jgi:hypothetical protein
MFESKLGVVNGESLADDMEGWGDELVLKRLRAPGGEGPKETVEIIRARVGKVVGLLVGRSAHWMSSPFCARVVTRKSDVPLDASEPSTIQSNEWQPGGVLYFCLSMLSRIVQVVERRGSCSNESRAECRRGVQAVRS